MKITLLALSVVSLCTAVSRGDVVFTEKTDCIRVEVDGELLTEYVHDDSPHVYFWPLLGPGGVKMTRAWPMEDVPGEDHDHLHHRSMWFAHGEVNGTDFWTEPVTWGKKTPKLPLGKIVHTGVKESKGGKDSGVLVTTQDWKMPDGSTLLTSEQTLRAFAGKGARVMDWEIKLTAGEKDAVFGDTKEGTAAIRIAETMRLKQPKAPGEGHILNDSGTADDAVWGQKAKWVDMSGPIAGKTYGIAFMQHPTSFRAGSRWHARDYGLFAANPFCEAEMEKGQAKGAGAFTLKAKESVTFKYRIILHEGDAAAAKVAESYADYAK